MNTLYDIDERFQESVWESRIPIKIEMASNDLMSAETPITLYFSLPRIGYLASLFSEIKKNFDRNISARLEDIWLEYHKTPLKWHIPFGVIVDSLQIDISQGPIPITVHVSSFPEESVIRFTSMDSLRFHYLHSIKEANIIKFPLENKILNLKKEHTNVLIKIVNENNTKMLKDYRQIMNSINDNGFQVVKKYPVRLFFSNGNSYITKPAVIPKDKASNFTMIDFFKQVLKEDVCSKIIDKCKIIIHGIDVEMEMSFLFYYFNFCYLDNFLYISFIEIK